jgi:hypothetical protein
MSSSQTSLSAESKDPDGASCTMLPQGISTMLSVLTLFRHARFHEVLHRFARLSLLPKNKM